MICIDAITADEAWTTAAQRLLGNVAVTRTDSRLGISREMSHCVLSLANPRHRWVYSRSPAINPAFAIAEVIWILSGSRESRLLNFWNRQLPQFAGDGDVYHGAYGYRLRSHFGKDQLEGAYRTLRHNPSSRQVVLQMWDPVVDAPTENGEPANADVPCNVGAFLKIRNGRLDWTQVVRSNDIYRGLPYNLVQFTCLQEVVAGWLGVEMGTYTHMCDSLHLYESDAETMSIEAHYAVPIDKKCRHSLALGKDDFDVVLAKLVHTLNRLSAEDLEREEFEDLRRAPDVPESYKNYIAVLAAEAARRRRWVSLDQKLLRDCTDPYLQVVWDRWMQRVSSISPDLSSNA